MVYSPDKPHDDKEKEFIPTYLEAQMIACSRCGRVGIARVKVKGEILCGFCRVGVLFPKGKPR